MNKSSSLIIAFSIVLGFVILGAFVKVTFSDSPIAVDSTKVNNSNVGAYEMFAVNKNNIIIFDKQSGEYWRKFIPESEGPTEWRKEPSPVSNAK
ncbi:hypothetical protein [Paenibacillus prosopidis]|uniref:Uncharacterized protein n=1 Tax=Paenibacillus prosopidis TaxID=630520 RepID=A0A368W669_9BACL|nr:hypothetical protein [Paenibacillus prosopidis]RCW49346.1 hypothetical protein DFP97_1042 [Paenibacillus prosopidis]